MPEAITTPHTDGGQASSRARFMRLLVGCALLVLFALVLLVALTHHPELLKGVDLGNEQGTASGKEDIDGIGNAIAALQGPANVTVGSLGGLGAAAGAAMMAVGSPKGMKVLGSSAGALAALGLGNGLIA